MRALLALCVLYAVAAEVNPPVLQHAAEESGEKQPITIRDPTAKRPADWDDEMDGVWQAPEIPNPEYKQPEEITLIYQGIVSMGGRENEFSIHIGQTIAKVVDKFCAMHAHDETGSFFAECKKNLMKTIPAQMGKEKVETVAFHARAKRLEQLENEATPDDLTFNQNTRKILFQRDVAMGGKPVPFRIIAGDTKRDAISRFCNRHAHDENGEFVAECAAYLDEGIELDDAVIDRIMFYRQHMKTMASKASVEDGTGNSTLIQAVSVALTMGQDFEEIVGMLEFHTTRTKKQGVEIFCNDVAHHNEAFYYYDFKFVKACINHIKPQLGRLLTKETHAKLATIENEKKETLEQLTEGEKTRREGMREMQAEKERNYRRKNYNQNVKNTVAYRQGVTLGNEGKEGATAVNFIIYQGQSVADAVGAFCHEHVLDHHRPICVKQFLSGLPISKEQRDRFASDAAKFNDSPMNKGVGTASEGAAEIIGGATAGAGNPSSEPVEEFEL
jgi:hypothetical protein